MPVSDTISHCNLAQLLNEGGLDVHFPSVSFGNETTLGSWVNNRKHCFYKR